MNNELRKVFIKEKETESRDIEKPLKEYVGFFHKWFDGINKWSKSPEQVAIVELEDGSINEFPLHSNTIRFQTEQEIKNENLKGWGGDPTII
ncbi:hypothetical protein [Aquimarina macrocephali]|uniref:hypothetical protein n=1 Tax=Aquimarina macrocephali TaxID=666563 RepID=UPI003F66AB0E